MTEKREDWEHCPTGVEGTPMIWRNIKTGRAQSNKPDFEGGNRRSKVTKIINGYTQPDLVGTQSGRTKVVFVEDLQSFKDNIEALIMTLREIALDRSDYYRLEDLEEICITFYK